MLEITRNEYGHAVITFIASGISGEDEIELLHQSCHFTNPFAEMILKSKIYGERHRLVAGQEYRIAFMPGSVIEKDSQRSTKNLRQNAMEFCGYEEPRAGHIPSLRIKMSDEQIKVFGLWSVNSLHKPVIDSTGEPYVLRMSSVCPEGLVVGFWDPPGNLWPERDLFAFPVSL